MSKYGKEQVLVFPSALVRHTFKGPLVKDRASIDAYLAEVLDPATLGYILRDDAEADEDFLQVIPYVVLMRGREVYRYQRTPRGGENRLHGKWSVGVGGHINPVDGEPGSAYWPAFRRELAEEVDISGHVIGQDRETVAGLLYDPSDAVGRVHFGVVHIVKLPSNATVAFRDPALAAGHFQHLLDLHASNDVFENWSRIVIGGLL